MTVRESIDKFIAFFRQQRLDIGQIEALPIYRKILYLVEIDALSRAAFPSEKGHKDRVLKFLNEYSNWSIRDRVSAIHLQHSLKTNGELSGPLFDLVTAQVQEFKIRKSKIYPNDDLTIEEVQCSACSEVPSIVKEARYDELFYTYRNTLIHEFREPGKYQLPFEEYPNPFWDRVLILNAREMPWELVFPEKFLEKLCEGCINGLERCLIEQNRDPLLAYKFETPWPRR